MDASYHLKYLKSLIKGAPKKKGDKKEPLTVTPGRWNSESDVYMVGIDTDGIYQITWRFKDGRSINKLQSLMNFSYIAALNPEMILSIIDEYDRLASVEQELISLKTELDNRFSNRVKKFIKRIFNKIRL